MCDKEFATKSNFNQIPKQSYHPADVVEVHAGTTN